MFNVRGFYLHLGSSYDVGRADHTMNRHCPKCPLPSAHHVINEVSGCHTLVLGSIVAPSDLSLQVFLLELLIRDPVVNGYTKDRKFIIARLSDFTKDIGDARNVPMRRYISQPLNSGGFHDNLRV